MIKNLYILALLSLSISFTSCKKEDLEFKNDFKKSEQAWQAFQISSKNSYSYVVVSSSVFGSSAETTIFVKDGIVIGRSFVHKQLNYGMPPTWTVIKEWEEDDQTLNTHTEGAKTLTLDQIYAQAETDYLKKRPNADTYFEADNNGMISSAGYVERGCQDDCFIGIKITSISVK